MNTGMAKRFEQNSWQTEETGSSAVTNALEREGGKKKKKTRSYYNLGIPIW